LTAYLFPDVLAYDASGVDIFHAAFAPENPADKLSYR
jgi:hypothetical protein